MDYVDLHSHPLPALDDGPSTFAESVGLIEAAWKTGTRCMVATPHMFHSGVGSNDSAEVARVFAEFEVRLAAHRAARRAEYEAETGGVYLENFALALGAENYVGEAFLEALAAGAVLTLGGTRYLLLEFWPMTTAIMARQAVDAVRDRGYLPVLAHVERYGFLQNEPSSLGDLIEVGCTAQVNASAILGHQGLRLAQLADRWLRRGLIAVVASDGHDTRARRPQLDEVADHLRSRYGRATVERCLQLNPASILADEATSLPEVPRTGWWRRKS